MKAGFLLGFLCFCISANAQSITPVVINSTGGIFQNGSNVIVFSAGETAIARYSTVNNQLTEGFLQPHFAAIVGIAEFNAPGFRFYPNPATNSLIIENSNPAIKSLRFYNGLGQSVLEATATYNSIDISSFKPGLYIISVQDVSGTSIQTFKFIKQ
jgi:hypothetical protein